MAPKASEIADEIVKSRDLYLAGLSERTRTLSIGALALIWGLFSQKPSDHAFDITLTWKRILLGIGLCAIAVLVLDFGEYACAYQFRQRVIGERVGGRIPYEKLEVGMRSAKIILGSFP